MEEIRWFSRRGKNKLKCNEHVYFRGSDKCGFYSLMEDGAWAGEIPCSVSQIQRAVADVFEERSAYFFQETLEDIKALIVEIICEVYYNLTKECVSKNVYDGTLLMVFVSREHNCCRWVHLGTGMIIREDCQGEMAIVSHPEGRCKGRVSAGQDKGVRKESLRGGESKLQGIRRWMILTRGAFSLFYRNRELTENGKDFLGRGTEVFGRILEQLEMEDDYSMIEIEM